MMLKTRVVLSLLLAMLAHAQGAAGQEAAWSRYTYPGEEFSAEFPGMPSVFNTLRGVNDDWRKTERVRVFGHYSGGVVFFVVAYDKPDRSESFDFFATQLRGAWGLAPKASVTLGGFEGRSYSVVGTQRGRIAYDLYGEARAFRTKKHAYLALALTREAGRPEVERFLNSFALGASPAGEGIAGEEPVTRYVPPKKSEGAQPGDVRGAGESPKLVQPEGGAPERAPGAPLTMRGVERKALIVYKPEPPYTEEARQGNVTGVVRLRVVLSSAGRVTDIEVLKPLAKGLTESAMRVARQMRFFPAEKDGRPVSQYMILEYSYAMY
jgi:TonB family protein